VTGSAAMDGISAAAGVIALGSAAVDIAELVKRLYDYWQSIQEAPDDFRAITEDLAYLHAILRRSSLRKSTDVDLVAILESCIRKVEGLVALTEDLEPGFASRSKRMRKWSAMKMVFRESKINKFRQSLNETKSTILLANQIASE
jgi:F420-0:gamma-glutamyl ligase